MDEDDEDITQEDCWTVISSYFEDKGLVRQQLDSFDEFIQNTMQEIVDENSTLVLQTQSQYTGQEGDVPVRMSIYPPILFLFFNIFILYLISLFIFFNCELLIHPFHFIFTSIIMELIL